MLETLELIQLSTAKPEKARSFYTRVFGLTNGESDTTLDLHGAGALAINTSSPKEHSSRGLIVVNYIVAQPREVTRIIDAASSAGAEVLRPGKKGFFGGFAGSFRSPDGSVWKISSPHKKDTAPASALPRPTEVVIMLGVADMTESRKFYKNQGFTVDRDYGTKFVDFTFNKPAFRLAIMPHKALAKDVGVENSTPEPGGGLVLCTSRSMQHRGDPSIIDPDSIAWKIIP